MSQPTTTPLRRFDASQGPRKIGADEGAVAELGGCDARFLVYGEESGGGFSLVEHPVPPRSLCAPYHRHAGVDEYSFVLEGRMGAMLGEDVIYAEAGELAFKPRDQWHTFAEMDRTLKDGTFNPPELEKKYAIEFEMESVPRLCERFGLVHPLADAASTAA